MKYILIIILVAAAAFILWKMRQFDKTIPTMNPEDGTVPNDWLRRAEGSDFSQQDVGQTTKRSKPTVDYTQSVLIDFSEDEPMRGREKKVKPGKGENGSFYAKVAGITFNCTPSDVGVIRGTVRPEPTNEFDPDAMAIVSESGRTLGYIGAYDLLEYRRWCRLREFPFVGYIIYDGYTLSGRILAINPDDADRCQRTEQEFLMSIEANLGIKSC